MNRIIVWTFLSLLVVGCEKDTHFIKKKYYDTGELLSETSYRSLDSVEDGVFKEYYKNGKLKKKFNVISGKNVDTAYSYFETGELKNKQVFEEDSIHLIQFYKKGTKSLEGTLLNKETPIRIGWFKRYRENQTLLDSLEYINYEGKEYLNQRISFNQKGEIIDNNSGYYDFKLTHIKDSIYEYEISYDPLINEAQVFLVVNKNINEDFSNLGELKMDTIFMENNRIKSTITSTVPYKTLKGFFYERKASVKDTIHKDSIRMTIRGRNTYFNNTTYIEGWKSEKNVTPSKASIM